MLDQKSANNNPKNFILRTDWGLGSYFIHYWPLFFFSNDPKQDFRAQDGVSRSQHGSPAINGPSWQRNVNNNQKTSLSVLTRDPALVISVINNSIFIEWFEVSRVFGDQDGISRSQSGSPTTKAAKLDQKTPKQSRTFHFLLWWFFLTDILLPSHAPVPYGPISNQKTRGSYNTHKLAWPATALAQQCTSWFCQPMTCVWTPGTKPKGIMCLLDGVLV